MTWMLILHSVTIMKHLKYLLVTLVISLSFASAVRAVDSSPCEVALLPLSAPVRIAAIAKEDPTQAFRVDTYNDYVALVQANRDVRNLLPTAFVEEILVNPEFRYYSKNLKEFLDHFKASSPSDIKTDERFRLALRETLKGKVPESTIEIRISNLYGRSGGTRVIRALGDMTLGETQDLYYGSDPLHPSPESLVGQYLAETGATTQIRRFSLGPEKPGEFGPERLVVSVSAASYASYQKLFSRMDSFNVLGHAYLIQNGKMTSYMHNGIDARMPSVGNILPTIILKTTEGQRVEQYLNLMVTARLTKGGMYATYMGNPVMEPWLIDGYCGTEVGYSNCTHWIGNMPIGDKLVRTYAFPALQEAWGNPNLDKSPRIARLGSYQSDIPLMNRVWKSPGNQQFGEVVGLGDANLRGDLANPGWVITTLIGPASAERVPVVFYIVNDHTQPIPENFVPIFERPM